MCVCVMAVMLGSSLSCGDKGVQIQSQGSSREKKRKRKKSEVNKKDKMQIRAEDLVSNPSNIPQ